MRLLKKHSVDLNQMPELGEDLSIVNGVLLAEKLNDFTEMGDLELAFVRNSLLTNEKAKDLLASYISPDDRSARITFRIIDSFENINRNVLLEKIDSYLQTKLENTNVEYQLSGLGVLYNNLIAKSFWFSNNLFSFCVRRNLLDVIASFQITSYIFNCIIYSTYRCWVYIFIYERFFNSFRHNDNNYCLYICWYVS